MPLIFQRGHNKSLLYINAKKTTRDKKYWMSLILRWSCFLNWDEDQFMVATFLKASPSHYFNGVRERYSFFDGHSSFACEIKYLLAILYGCFTLSIVMVKRPYTIGVKDLISQVKLPCPSKSYTFCVHRLSSLWVLSAKTLPRREVERTGYGWGIAGVEHINSSVMFDILHHQSCMKKIPLLRGITWSHGG